MIPCPVRGCRQRCKSPDTLFVHLAADHLKNDVVAALVRRVAGDEEHVPSKKEIRGW